MAQLVRIRKLMMSTDGTEANRKEIKSDALGNARFNPGRQTENRTRSGDAGTRNENIKRDSSLAFTVDLNTDTDASVDVFVLGEDVARSFLAELEIGSTGLVGVSVSGKAAIEDQDGINHNINAGTTVLNIMLKQAGDNWTWSKAITA